MLVNTSKVGQFVMPIPINDTIAGASDMDSPWYQVLNYPSVRNIALVKRMSPSRQTVLRMKVNATEDYIRLESQGVGTSHPVQFTTTGLEDPWNTAVPTDVIADYSASDASVPAAKIRAARFQVGRRRFRWTRQWLLWESASAPDVPNLLYVRNDRKQAHGVQFMVKEMTYWQSTVPYFNVSITAQVEFRGKLMQQSIRSITNASQVMFPYTNATFSTIA